MKNKLTNNIGLKLASVFLAVILWLVVTSIDDPTVPESFYDIPVTLLNTELITDSGRVFDVIDDTDLIGKVTVRGPRSIVRALRAEDIIATADVSELSSLDTISIRLTTNVSSNNVSLTGSIDTVKLNIENKRNKPLPLKASTSGECEDGYIVGEITTDQNLVRISGPQSIIDKVVKASVNVDVTGMTSDIVTNADIILYDAEDNVIDAPNIIQNIESVGVKVSILQKVAVTVNFNVSGKPAPGFKETGKIEGNGDVVEIAGKTNIVRNISEIEIPEEILDITDQTEDYVTNVDIRQYLPDNVALVNSQDAIRTVTVFIEPEVSKKLEIREERVRVINIPDGYNATISGLEESFIIEAIGLSIDVTGLQASSISGVVDIQKWMQQQRMQEPEPGYYTVEVDFGLPSNVTLLEPVKVTLHISEKEQD